MCFTGRRHESEIPETTGVVDLAMEEDSRLKGAARKSKQLEDGHDEGTEKQPEHLVV